MPKNQLTQNQTQFSFNPLEEPVNHNTIPQALQQVLLELREIKESLAGGEKLRVDINDQDKVYSLKELANRWSVSQSTIIRMMRAGELKYSKLRRQYRIRHRDAMESLEKTGRTAWPSYQKAVSTMKK